MSELAELNTQKHHFRETGEDNLPFAHSSHSMDPVSPLESYPLRPLESVVPVGVVLKCRAFLVSHDTPLRVPLLLVWDSVFRDPSSTLGPIF
jgi:hypothetical protein